MFVVLSVGGLISISSWRTVPPSSRCAGCRRTAVPLLGGIATLWLVLLVCVPLSLMSRRVIWSRQVMMGDGQVSQGDMVVKPNAIKVRKLGDGRVLAGYAGSTADALTLMERLEGKLEEHEGTHIRREFDGSCKTKNSFWPFGASKIAYFLPETTCLHEHHHHR